MYVDDDEDFTELTAAFLERECDRFRVETATTVAEALVMPQDIEVECVVSDYYMPGRTGIELLSEVREHRPDIPFLLFTGAGNEGLASSALSAGVTDYLQKEAGTEQYTVLATESERGPERTGRNRGPAHGGQVPQPRRPAPVGSRFRP